MLLLIPVSRREEFAPIRRTPWQRLRNRARRALDGLLWRSGLTPQFHYSTYEDRRHSNRGDIAIRIASIALLRAAFGGAVRVADAGWAELRLLDADWIDRHADLLVVGGGGYYGLDDAGCLAARVGQDAALLADLRIPAVSLAPGVNRALGAAGATAEIHPDSVPVLAGLLGTLRLSSARDRPSREALNRIAPGSTLALADPALFLGPAMAAEGAPDVPDGTLAVGLNLAFHGPDQGAALAGMLRLVGAAARDLAARRRCVFHYFVHSDAERVIPALLRRFGLRVHVVDGPVEEMLAAYGRLDLHVCQMLHSAILACNAGVPAINLAYDIKNAGFFEMMDLAEWCLPAAAVTPAQLATAMQRAAAEGPALRAHLAARRAALRAEMDDYLAGIAGLARQRRTLA